jgi:hypothetical protein
MDNQLEFENLLLENVLFKVQNQTLVDKTQNGRNGGKVSRRLQKNKSKIV